MIRLLLLILVISLVGCRKRGYPQKEPNLPPPDTSKGGLVFGDLYWTFNAGGQIISTPAIYNDKIIVSTVNGKVLSLDTNGNLLWEVDLGRTVASSPTVSQSGKIFITTYDGNIFCLDEMGNTIWNNNIPANILSSVAVYKDRIFVGATDNRIYSFDTSGNSLWSYPTAGPIFSTPAVSPSGMIVISSSDNYIYGFDTSGTLLLWKNVGGYTSSSPAFDSAGNIYLATTDGKIMKISGDSVIWQINLGSSIASSPVIDFDGVIVSSSGGRIMKVGFNGSVLWDIYVQPPVEMTPVLVEGNYFGIVGGDSLYFISDTGIIKSRMIYHSKSSPTVRNGYMYLGSDRGMVMSIKLEYNENLKPSFWPKLGKDLRNTFSSF